MGWIRIEDDFYDNGKIIAAGAHGVAVWIAAMGWCNRNLTDGMIPVIRSRQLVDFTGITVMNGMSNQEGVACADHAVQTLIGVELFHEAGHDCPDCVQPPLGSYVIHDYLKYQPSRQQVEAKAEANRERVRQFKERHKAGNAVGNALANARVTEQLHDTPNPNPNPSSTSVVTKKGGVTFPNARGTASRPICSKHPQGNDTDENCRGCMKTRQWDESHAADAQADELEAKRRAREISEGCPDCNGTNVIDIGDNEVRKCTHPDVIHA
jgi:hypothetical protein